MIFHCLKRKNIRNVNMYVVICFLKVPTIIPTRYRSRCQIYVTSNYLKEVFVPRESRSKERLLNKY